MSALIWLCIFYRPSALCLADPNPKPVTTKWWLGSYRADPTAARTENPPFFLSQTSERQREKEWASERERSPERETTTGAASNLVSDPKWVAAPYTFAIWLDQTRGLVLFCLFPLLRLFVIICTNSGYVPLLSCKVRFSHEFNRFHWINK